MTTSNFTTNASNLELIELSNQIHDIAATIAGVKPSLLMIRDGVNNPENGDVLTLVSRMTDTLNAEMCNIADRLSVLSLA